MFGVSIHLLYNLNIIWFDVGFELGNVVYYVNLKLQKRQVLINLCLQNLLKIPFNALLNHLRASWTHSLSFAYFCK